MRNYTKIQCIRLYPLPFDADSFYVLFGGTDDSLLEHKNQFLAYIQTVDPGRKFRIDPPSVIWFELNLENFVRILDLSAGAVWEQTRLNDRYPPPTDFRSTLYDMTRVKVEGSPRKTWSHGH